ncbi:MAG: hypothetical protein JSV20_09640 [Candidatus Bathyarchaeota archaeon]|nr:MAG: hypothetical protein JSV20_09640 [Candidatus Bathyarchaeota archaeon]
MTPRMGIRLEHRGRPRGKSKSYYTYLNSIISLAYKHNVDPERLADTFFDAWKKKTAHYGRLTITCREINHDTATFLIEKDKKAIWQSPLNLESIRNPNIREYIKNNPIPDHMTQQKYSKDQKIDNLKIGMKKINIIGRIIEKPPASLVNTRWGSQACVSNVTIADNTGSIRLSLWNDQIDMVQIDDQVELKNCYVARYAGTPQIRLGRKGTITIVNQP